MLSILAYLLNLQVKKRKTRDEISQELVNAAKNRDKKTEDWRQDLLAERIKDRELMNDSIEKDRDMQKQLMELIQKHTVLLENILRQSSHIAPQP